MNNEQLRRMHGDRGFVAALDQSGGSTPKALALYGISEGSYRPEEMFDMVHKMRTRIVTSPAFTGEHILGAILFEDTMRREFEGQPAPDYLWEKKRIVPFLKVDQGLAEKSNGVQLMKPMPGLPALLAEAAKRNIFGTKMRSVIHEADPSGVASLVDQQFGAARQILAAGLCPIVEPEVDIHSPQKGEAEELLKQELFHALDGMGDAAGVMLKLSIPTVDGFYTDLMRHPKVVRVVALSGGYSRDEADARLARNPGLIASFSRALVEGLGAGQTDDEFNAALGESIREIYQASVT